ncbi:MAG: hypothetical protein HAW67_01555 [Endozoicomonadaceae bacterium]|nr:hypothetical protein [Endozoicomonadaceae bacterium]
MQKLANEQGVVVPDRPNYTKEIVTNGAIKALKSGHLYNKVPDDEQDKFLRDISHHYFAYIDAYELAKRMEQDGYDVNSDFVEDMDHIDS